jgi:hypothetical protein
MRTNPADRSPYYRTTLANGHPTRIPAQPEHGVLAPHVSPPKSLEISRRSVSDDTNVFLVLLTNDFEDHLSCLAIPEARLVFPRVGMRRMS